MVPMWEMFWWVSSRHAGEQKQTANMFDYLTRIQENTIDVIQNPGKWLPWNYKETIDSIARVQ